MCGKRWFLSVFLKFCLERLIFHCQNDNNRATLKLGIYAGVPKNYTKISYQIKIKLRKHTLIEHSRSKKKLKMIYKASNENFGFPEIKVVLLIELSIQIFLFFRLKDRSVDHEEITFSGQFLTQGTNGISIKTRLFYFMKNVMSKLYQKGF